MFTSSYRKLIAFLLASLLVFTSLAWMPVNTTAYEIDEDDLFFVEDLFTDEDFLTYVEAHVIENFGRDFMENHSRSIATVHTIFDSFPQSRAGDMMPPDNFGGLYIDDCGNLVILVTNSIVAFAADSDAVAFSAMLNDVLREDTGITTREVEFSYAELMEAIYFLQDFHAAYPEVIFRNASMWYLDVINNRVVVGLVDYTPEEIALFRQEVLDSRVLMFREHTQRYIEIDDTPTPYYFHQQYDIVPFSTTHHPGHRIFTTVEGGSIGYRARRGTQTGFVTAAHIGPVNWGNTQASRVVRAANGTHIGDVSVVSLQTFDAAFIQNRSGHSVSNQLPRILMYPAGSYDRFHSPSNAASVVGGLVFHYGTFHDGHRTLMTGRVTALNRAAQYRDERHGTIFATVDAVNFTALTGGGRSGGIVFAEIFPQGMPHIRSFGVLGIHVAGSGMQGYFVRAQRINANLGLQFYQ